MFKLSKLLLNISFCTCVCYAQAQTNGNDPTRPLGYAHVAEVGTVGGVTQDALTLSSILISKDRKVAIINGQQLHEKQTIKGVGAVVKKIDTDAVTLQQGNKIWRVLLNKTAIRK